MFLLAACAPTPQSSGSAPASAAGHAPGTTLTIGVDLPMSGGEAPNGEPTRNGIQMAIDEANDNGGVAGFQLQLDVRDDAVNGVHNPDQGAANAQALVSDPNVIAMIGPFNSNVARSQIPVTAPAGLLQCSPANTAPDMTKPEFGATELRGDNPPSYVRVATTDDVQGPALAEYMFNDLKIKSVFIVDDTETYGQGLAENFDNRFQELGGTVTGHEGVPNPDGSADYTSVLTNAKSTNPGAVFFGGTTTTGAAQVRLTMGSVGMGDLPFMGGDGIQDGSGSTDGTFINLAGDNAANSYSSVAAIHDIPNPEGFANDYKDKFNSDPGAYSASGYACAQVIIQALKSVAGDVTTLEALRAAVREYALGGNQYDTVLGPLSFDENGDTSQHVISFYKTDMSADDGAWVFDKQQDFAK
jgi:branched-chain amino acid transport system substrate-binding protein